MANRTLRRAYNRDEGNALSAANANGSDAGDASESVIGDKNADTISNGDGEESIGESDSAGGIGYVTVDPSNLGDYIVAESSRNRDDNGDGNRRSRKPRADAGKPRGTRTRKSAEIPTLVTIHNILNSWGQFLFKELALDSEEKDKLDKALANFAEYHELPLLSPKTASTIELLNALAMVYGPRVYVIQARLSMEAKIKRAKKVNPFVAHKNESQDAVQ